MDKIVTCIDIDGNTYEVPASKLEWRPSAYGIVIKDGRILLSKQFGDRYDLPGGGLEPGEKPEAGVIREVKEETGIDVASPRLIGFENNFFYWNKEGGKAYHSLLFYFACDYAGGKLSTEGFDEYEKEYADMAEWIPLEQLNTLKLASTIDYRNFVSKAVEQKSL